MSKRPRQLTSAEAFDEIQRIVAVGGVSFRRHVWKDRGPERGIFSDDVMRVLERGTVSVRAEWSDDFENWKYTISGRGYDNEPVVVVVALEPGYDRLTVITVHGD